MIIDVHAHLWAPEHTPAALRDYFSGRGVNGDGAGILTAEGLLRSMEEAGIDHAVVSALAFSAAWDNAAIAPVNQYVMEQVKRSAGKLTGFCTVAAFGGEASAAALRECVEEKGFRGLKLHCNMQQFYPNDERLYPLYAVMEEYGLPVLFHSGGIGVRPYKDRFGHPSYVDDVACDFPGLPIILGHAGRIWYDDTAMLLRKHPNVYADISTNFGRGPEEPAKPLQSLFEKVKCWAGTTEHLLFGSDYPFYGQQRTLANIRAFSAGAAQELASNTERFCRKHGLIT